MTRLSIPLWTGNLVTSTSTKMMVVLIRVRLELLLVKMSHKKRKESASPVVLSLGTSEVPANPSEENPPSKAPALSIPSKSFSLSGFAGVGRVKTYSLLIRVYCNGYVWDTDDNMLTGSSWGRRGYKPG